MTYLQRLEQAYPWIKWREPVIVNGRFGCRICIASAGLKSTDVDKLPISREGFERHFATVHDGGARK